MKRVSAILILLLTCCLSAIATSEKEWQKANAFYSAKQYDSAVYYYEQLATSQPLNAAVRYNLANSYYRLNQIGPAVLNYEKALHIRPSYKEASDNLYLTQSRISNRIPPLPEIFFLKWWHSITSGSKATLWAIISLVLFLSIIGLLMAVQLRRVRTVPPQVYGGLALLWALTLSFAIVAASHKADSGKAVVMQYDAPIYANPRQAGKYISLVPEGTTVSWLTTQNGWVQVQLPDGRVGWIRMEQIAKI